MPWLPVNLPKNSILRTLAYVTTISVVLCYAWLAANLLEPRFEASEQVAKLVLFRSGDRLGLYSDFSRQRAIEAKFIQDEIEDLEKYFVWIGPLNRKLNIIVDSNQPDRLTIGDDRIEIGTKVVGARGQLKKAVLKSWLLQSGATEVSKSFLRIEIASDVLLSMLEGSLRLQEPVSKTPLAFDDGMKPWWSFADSYQGLCKTPWKSLELASLCNSADTQDDVVAISNLSFRAFLGSHIWNSYLANPVHQRLAFTKTWLKALKDSPTNALPEPKGWLAFLQGEIEILLPSKIDKLRDRRAQWQPSFEAPLIVIDEDGRVAAPGSLKIATTEIEIQKAKLAMVTACAAPTLKEVISLSVNADRVVWKPDCESKARDFVQVRPSSIKLAISLGFAKPMDRLDDFVAKSAELASKKEVNDVFGFKTARWDENAQAFQVTGAIEAVEWYRLDRAKL